MGLLAHNCLAPGFSTLVTNLFAMRSFKKSKRQDWLEVYKEGAANEIYTESFSSYFHHKTFAHAVEVCFTELAILLVAIDTQTSPITSGLFISPGDDVPIGDGTIGFFIAQEPDQVKLVSAYRPPSTAAMGMRTLSTKRQMRVTRRSISQFRVSLSESESLAKKISSEETLSQPTRETTLLEVCDEGSDHVTTVDSTGMMHWCLSRDLNQCILTESTAQDHSLKNHVILLLPKQSVANLGLYHFVAPLRSSSIRTDHLKNIVVLLHDPSLLLSEWNMLQNFRGLYIFKASSSLRRDLIALNVDKCCMCVIVSAGDGSNADVRDRATVLATLSIQTMFGDRANAIKVFGAAEEGLQSCIIPKLIPLTSEVECSDSVAFLDTDDKDDPSSPLYLTMPIACGRAFAVSALDSLLSCAYLDGNVLKLVRALLTGGSLNVESLVVEGLGLESRTSAEEATVACSRTVPAQLSLQHGPLEKLHHECYGDLLVTALNNFRILCLGIYRLVDPSDQVKKRYVITNPRYSLKVLPSDRVFVLMPSNLDTDGTRCVSWPSNESEFNGDLDFEQTQHASPV